MKRELSVKAIHTRVLKLGEPLLPFLLEHLAAPQQLEGAILAVTSKIVSLAENRIVAKANIGKEELVRQEADTFLGEIGYGCFLTIKHGLFIPSAGIDESNAESDFYIIYPENPFLSAQKIQAELSQYYGLKNFGVILTDSHTTALRAGVTGICLAHAGFKGVENKIGTPDLFGNHLKMTKINVADAISTAAVYCMGEANESCPLALIRANVEFISEETDLSQECGIVPEQDLYWPLYQKFMEH